jgi:iron complex transport system substrate-binding protein
LGLAMCTIPTMLRVSSIRNGFSGAGFLIFLLLISTAVFATGAPDAAVEDASRTVTDALGRSVGIPSYPERIVVAGGASLMVADALYAFETAPERTIGITRINQARGNFLPSIDPDYGEKAVLERNVGPEQVAALGPDLVILKSFMRARLGDGLELLGIPVVYVDFETPDQYQRDLLLLGSILGEEARAERLARYYRDVVDAVTARTADATTRPESLLIYADPVSGEVAFNVPPEGWIQTMLVEMAGGLPVWRDGAAGQGWIRVGFEQIAAWNPQKLFLVSYRSNPDELRESLLSRSEWQELRAVQDGELHVFPVDYYSWDQPDTRWALGLQWIATRMHPDLFEDLDVRQAAVVFFGLVYGMSREQVEQQILDPAWGDLN